MCVIYEKITQNINKRYLHAENVESVDCCLVCMCMYQLCTRILTMFLEKKKKTKLKRKKKTFISISEQLTIITDIPLRGTAPLDLICEGFVYFLKK